MRILLITTILLFLYGCATTIETLKPSKIYLLDGNQRVTVYRTYKENIYVIDDDTIIGE